ncbi:hypothetical protein FRB90_006712 [Tulasnella sp. 427]|nr:hypothetical protein FRB90_006712 [Tulasnella sp. 427]
MSPTTVASSSKPPKSQKKEKKQKEGPEQNPSQSEPEKHKASKSHSTAASTSKPPPADKKAVFRAVLDNPLRVEWPNIPLNIENNILALAVQLLETVRPYHEQRSEASRKGKNVARASRFRQKTANTFEKRKANKGKGAPAHEGSAAEETITLAVPEEAATSTRKRKRDASGSDDEAEESEEETDLPPTKKRRPDEHPEPPAGVAPIPPSRPQMLDHVVFGLNAVTKSLEAQSFSLRSASNGDPSPLGSRSSGGTHADQSAHVVNVHLKKDAPLRLVLVCRTDIDSPTMIAHLPTLTAACNSVRRASAQQNPPDSDVLLVGLPYGAETTLAEGSGLRRAAVVAFDAQTPGLEDRLAPFLPSIPILHAHWLAVAPVTTPPENRSKTSSSTTRLAPTHIKHLKTTAPKDIRAAKQTRTAEIQALKAKRRSGHASSKAGVETLNSNGEGDASAADQVAEDILNQAGAVRSGPGGTREGRQGSQRKGKKTDKQPVSMARPRKTLEKVVIRSKASGMGWRE